MQTLKRCFSVPHARLGWMLILFGVPAWFLFGRYADWKSLAFRFGTTRQTDGVITRSSKTHFTIGDGSEGHKIHSVLFAFTDHDGIQRRARSWTEDALGPAGTPVRVEYIESDPTLTRICNCRSGALPLWAGTVVLFPLFGFSCILKAIYRRPDVEMSGRGHR